jgi:hypothetical protein
MSANNLEITLRDYFAAKAMQVFLDKSINNFDADHHWFKSDVMREGETSDIAFVAYLMADEMIESRKISP